MVREVNVYVTVTKILQRPSLFYQDLKRNLPLPFTSLHNFSNGTRLLCYSDLSNVFKVQFNIEQNKKSNKAAARKVTVFEKSGQQNKPWGIHPGGHILSTHLFLAIEIFEEHKLAGLLHLQASGNWEVGWPGCWLGVVGHTDHGEKSCLNEHPLFLE